MEVSKPPAPRRIHERGFATNNTTTFVGRDIQARSVKACAFALETGETVREPFEKPLAPIAEDDPVGVELTSANITFFHWENHLVDADFLDEWSRFDNRTHSA